MSQISNKQTDVGIYLSDLLLREEMKIEENEGMGNLTENEKKIEKNERKKKGRETRPRKEKRQDKTHILIISFTTQKMKQIIFQSFDATGITVEASEIKKLPKLQHEKSSGQFSSLNQCATKATPHQKRI